MSDPLPDLPAYSVFIPKGAKQGDCWHVKFRHEGKQIMRSLKTTDTAAAKREALELVRRTVAPRAIWAAELNEKCALVGDVVTIYLDMERPGPTVDTRAQNVRDLCRLAQVRFECERADVMKMPLAVLNARTIDRFVRERQGGRIYRDRILPTNLSINSTINHAKGVFTPRARRQYADAGLVIPPSIQELIDYAPLMERKRGRLARKFQGEDGLEISVWMEGGSIHWQANRSVRPLVTSEDAGTWVAE